MGEGAATADVRKYSSVPALNGLRNPGFTAGLPRSLRSLAMTTQLYFMHLHLMRTGALVAVAAAAFPKHIFLQFLFEQQLDIFPDRRQLRTIDPDPQLVQP